MATTPSAGTQRSGTDVGLEICCFCSPKKQGGEKQIYTLCALPLRGNVLVIVVISATKGFHSMTSVFIINLAVSDCLVGLGVMPFVALSLLYEDWHKIHELCLFVGYMSSVYCTASVLSVAAVSLDRYWAIVDCLRYDRPWTTQRTLYTITWIWIQAILTCCPPLLGWCQIVYVPSKYTCTTDWTTSTSYTIFFMAVSVFIPAAVLIYCHIRTINVARKHAKKIQILESQLQRNSPRKKVSEIEKPTCSQLIYIVNCKFLTDANSFDSQSITSFSPDLLNLKNLKRDIFSDNDFYGKDPCGRFRLILVLVVFICCWMPYMVINLIQAIEKATLQNTTIISSPVITTAYWLTLLNSDLNPLFYALLSKRFQKALQVFLRRICGRDPLTDVPSFHRRRTSSNVTGISQFHCPTDQHNQGENTGTQPSPVVSRHNSQQVNESLPGQLPNSTDPSISSYEKETDNENRSVLLNPNSLPQQFLQVPNYSPSQIRLPSVSGGKSSKLVCGNITIQVSCEEN
uniref:G-protein coupled receptors family 1 profile domain-containing protein n=1 Tax=Xenopus tropicalis TaxID=8364 RepID=A0A803JUN7_XENTR